MSELSKEILHTEFSHASGVTYLDHAGATLYSTKQLADHMTDLTSHLYCNPHSSGSTTAAIDSTREMVLRHFHTDSDYYDIVFTSGCTAALNLLSHTFPWRSHTHSCSEGSSLFCYLDDNHTSVVGMREVANQNGAKTMCISISDLTDNPSEPHPPEPHPLDHASPSSGPHCLFAYPAQSNFSGHKYPLSWCEAVPSGKVKIASSKLGRVVSRTWMVVLDAASYVSSSPLDLSTHQPHFVCLSFYKLFGFPTGLGALLVRKDCGGLLSKPYYGGGTMKVTDPWTSLHLPKDQLHERLEDGTLPFLDILALRHGFATLTRLGRSMEVIRDSTFKLAKMTYASLSKLRHDNGGKLCHLYCDTNFEDPQKQGPIVNFNLLWPSGRVVGYSQVEKLASVFNIHLRTGCFCNTGACMKILGINSEKLKYHLEQGHECGDNLDLIDGTPTGSVRVSFGYMSTFEDVEKLLDFIKECFVNRPKLTPNKSNDNSLITTEPARCATDGIIDDGPPHLPYLPPPSSMTIVSCGDQVQVTPGMDRVSPTSHDAPHSPPTLHYLHSTTLYPIKSCAGFRVQKWPVGEKGLMFDRDWMVVAAETGALLSQKQQTSLCLIQPSIDLVACTLTLSAPGHSPLSLVIQDTRPNSKLVSLSTTKQAPLMTRVCRDRVHCIDCGDAVSKWLTCVLGVESRLVRQNPYYKRKSLHDRNTNEEGYPLLSLANEAQYLLLSMSSLESVLREVKSNSKEWETIGVGDLTARFRPNFVVGGERVEPYAEESWTEVKIGDLKFQVVGKCTRCQMVCIDPKTGKRGPEPLKTLRKNKGISFGIYLTAHNTILDS